SKLRDNGCGRAGRATRSYPKRSRTSEANRWSAKSSNQKLNEHSNQLEQSAEKLSQLESENLNLRDENPALNMASNKKGRFRAQVRPMPTLETPNSGTVRISLLWRREEMRLRAIRLRTPRPTTRKIATLSRNPIRKHLMEQRKWSLPWSLTWNKCSPRGSMQCSPW
ncbi:unnamed protein product, partial [Brassica rapa]